MADTSFADAFIQGREMRKQHERQRKLDEEAKAQREFQNSIATQGLDMQKFKAAIDAAQIAAAAQQGKVSESTSAGPGISAPTAAEAAAPATGLQPAAGGIIDFLRAPAQPPALERIEPSPVRVTASPSQKALGLQDLLIPVLSRQAVARQKAEDLQLENDAKAIPINEQLSAALGGFVTPGKHSQGEVAAAQAAFQGQENRKSREQIAAESAAARGEAARQRAHEKAMADATKKATADEDALFFARQVHSGEAALDEVPQKLRASAGILADVLSKQEPGKVFTSKKDREKYKSFEDAAVQAEGLLANFNPAAVGPFDARTPTVRGKTAYYEAQISGMFNELGKLRSGGAITPQEYARLAAELPVATDMEEVFKAKAQRFLDEMRNRQAGLVAGGKAQPLGGDTSGAGSAPGGTAPKRLKFNPATGELE